MEPIATPAASSWVQGDVESVGRTVGDGAELEGTYRIHADEATRMAYLLTGDRARADDLVQDAFLRLASRTLPVTDERAIRAYLRRMLVNGAISEARRDSRRRAREEAVAPRERSAAGDDTVEERADLWKLLERLPLRQRAALVLRFYADLSERDIAAALRCRPGTVKSLTARGLDALRVAMGSQGA